MKPEWTLFLPEIVELSSQYISTEKNKKMKFEKYDEKTYVYSEMNLKKLHSFIREVNENATKIYRTLQNVIS